MDCISETPGQEVHFINEVQDDNPIRLYVPNLKNFDSYGGRLKSEIVVTSIDQTVEEKKEFTGGIEVPDATNAKNPIPKNNAMALLKRGKITSQ